MAKIRYIQTRFWNDNYISGLKPLERYLFLYFLTNTSTNLCGIYELPLKNISSETDLTMEQVFEIMEKFRADGRIFYADGWVGIKNFLKNQNQNSPQVCLGIKREIELIPSDILDKLIGYGYPMDTLSLLNLTKLNLTKLNYTHKKEGATIIKKMESVDAKNKTYYANKTQRNACDFLLTEYGLDKVLKIIDYILVSRGKRYFPSITSPYELQQKWTKVGEAYLREKHDENNKPLMNI